MRNRRLRCMVLIGNKKKIDELAETEGLTKEEYLEYIALNEICFGDENLMRYLRWRGIKAPFELDEEFFPKIVVKTKLNSEDFSAYLKENVLKMLEIKSRTQSFQGGNVGIFLDKVCLYPVFTLNGIKLNGGENGKKK